MAYIKIKNYDVIPYYLKKDAIISWRQPQQVWRFIESKWFKATTLIYGMLIAFVSCLVVFQILSWLDVTIRLSFQIWLSLGIAIAVVIVAACIWWNAGSMIIISQTGITRLIWNDSKTWTFKRIKSYDFEEVTCGLQIYYLLALYDYKGKIWRVALADSTDKSKIEPILNEHGIKSMNKLEYRNFKDILSSAAGPSPWYLRNAKALISQTLGKLSWVEIEDGNVALKTEDNKTIAIIGVVCYVLPLSSERVLIWFEEKKGSIKLILIDINQLKEISEFGKSLNDLKNKLKHVVFFGGEIASATLQTNHDKGVYELDFPNGFNEINELLILADSGNLQGQIDLRLMIVHPQQGNFEVFPQKWFNDGPYDFGYQWVTRVAREPNTNRLLGEGIRLGYFVLDQTNMQVEKWLEKDLFHRPK